MRQVIHPQEAAIQFIGYNTDNKTYTLTASVLPHNQKPFLSVYRKCVQWGKLPTAWLLGYFQRRSY